jgi:hypothetical protein
MATVCPTPLDVGALYAALIWAGLRPDGPAVAFRVRDRIGRIFAKQPACRPCAAAQAARAVGSVVAAVVRAAVVVRAVAVRAVVVRAAVSAWAVSAWAVWPRAAVGLASANTVVAATAAPTNRDLIGSSQLAGRIRRLNLILIACPARVRELSSYTVTGRDAWAPHSATY